MSAAMTVIFEAQDIAHEMRCFLNTIPRSGRRVVGSNPGHLCQWRAREDSNLRPSGYERVEYIEKPAKNQHFRARSLTFIHVHSPRFIGQSLVRRVNLLHNEFSRSAAFIFDESIGEISDDNVHAVLSESQVPAFRASRRANPAVKELALDLAEISFREDGPKAEDLPRSTKKRGSSSIACP